MITLPAAVGLIQRPYYTSFRETMLYLRKVGIGRINDGKFNYLSVRKQIIHSKRIIFRQNGVKKSSTIFVSTIMLQNYGLLLD